MKVFSLKFAATAVATVLAANGLAYVSSAHASTENCVNAGNLAKSIAEGRDSGYPLSEMLGHAKGDSGIETLMVAIYEHPSVTPEESSTAVIVACMKESRRIKQ